jgi:hypothetical protein
MQIRIEGSSLNLEFEVERDTDGTKVKGTLKRDGTSGWRFANAEAPTHWIASSTCGAPEAIRRTLHLIFNTLEPSND